MDDDFATMSTYEQLEYRTGQLEAQRQISKLLNVRAERAEDERDALRAEVARLQREKAVAVAVANDRKHNEHALEAHVARLRDALEAYRPKTAWCDDCGDTSIVPDTTWRCASCGALVDPDETHE